MTNNIDTKTCEYCKVEKPNSEFGTYKYKNKVLLRNKCKECLRKDRKIWLNNGGSEKKKKSDSKWRKNNPEKVRQNQMKWAENNPQKVKTAKKKYNDNNKERNANRWNKYYTQNKSILNSKKKEYRANNIERERKKAREKQKTKRKSNIQHRLRQNIRNRLSRFKKNGSTSKALGCSDDDFIKHLENKFYPHPDTGEEMTWDNYGVYGWHMDHIIPLASFDLRDKEQHKKACHYTNIQPLWAKDNLKKGAK